MSKKNHGKIKSKINATNKNDAVKSNKKPKKREKKKDPNHVHESKGQSKALRYLKCWYEHHTGESVEWKFEKCRQIWLLQNAYDSKKIGKDDFKILLKYMKSIQGRMRERVLEEAQTKVSVQEDGKNDEKSDPLDELTVKRAKKIVKKLSATTSNEAEK